MTIFDRILDALTPRDGKWIKVFVPPVFLVAAVVTKLLSGPAASDLGPFAVIVAVYAGVGLAIGLLAAQLPRIVCAALLITIIGVAADLAFSIEHNLSIYLKQNWTFELLPRIVVIAIVLWGLSAVVLMIIGQRRWKALVVAGVAYLAGIVFAPPTPLPELPIPTPRTEAEGPIGRIVVQILLDEHIGIAGIPDSVPNAASLRQAITDFYVSRGFRLYADAYSPFTFTAASVPAMLNFDDPDPAKATLLGLEKRWSEPMTWFRYLKGQGYNTMAYTIGSFWNLCTGAGSGINSCRAYDPISRNHEGPFGDRYNEYLIAAVDNSLLDKSLCRWLGVCRSDSYNVASNSVEILDQVAHEVDVASGDTAIFAHVLLPHRPQRVDQTCAARYFGNQESEAELFEHYDNQIRCSMMMVGKIIDAITRRGALDRATIIVHGDHGLRPGETADTPAHLAAMTHSTLFAVHGPGIVPGVDGGFYRVQSLIPHFIAGRSLPAGDGVVWEYHEDPNQQPPLSRLSFPAGNAP